MKFLHPATIVATIAGLVAVLGPAAPASAQPVCGAHATVVESLRKSYAEAPVSVGVTAGGGIVEVFASEKGTWTLVITQPNGTSCLIAAGRDWENLPKLATGTKT